MPRSLLALTAGAVLLAACSPGAEQPADPEAVSVVASHYPVEFLVRQVGGDLVDVQSLTSPGTEPHDLELSPQQVGEVQQAATVFYLGGFQPAVDQAVTSATGTVVDLSQGLPLHGSGDDADPHVWLDPVLMQQMAATVADSLAAADPEHAQAFRANAAQLDEELGDLNQEWTEATKRCASRTMVVSHEAFGYLADRYGFTQKGISGLSPETEPSAAAIAELTQFVRDNGVTTVYSETLVDPAVAQTIAAEAGVDTATLDPLEGPPAEGDYFTAMRANLETLTLGQSCS